MNVSIDNAVYVGEAVKRMKALGLSDASIYVFKKGRLCMSIGGETHVVDVHDPIYKIIAKITSPNDDILPFYLIHGYYNIGEIISILYVSKQQDEWEDEWVDLTHNYVMAYCYNISHPNNSEFGKIVVKRNNGRLVRIG